MCVICNCTSGHLKECPEKNEKYKYFEYCDICKNEIFEGEKIFVNNFDDEIIYCQRCIEILEPEEILEILVRSEKL